MRLGWPFWSMISPRRYRWSSVTAAAKSATFWGLRPRWNSAVSLRRPVRIAAGEPHDPIEERCALRRGDWRSEQAVGLGLTLAVGSGDLAQEGVQGDQVVGVAVERLTGGAGDVPAVDDDLVERDQSGRLAGQVDAAGRCGARPGVGVVPCRGERVEFGSDRGAPARCEAPPVGLRWRAVQRPLHRGSGERHRQAAHVFDEVGEVHSLARGGPGEHLVADAGEQHRHLAGGGSQVEHVVLLGSWILRGGDGSATPGSSVARGCLHEGRHQGVRTAG